MSRYAKRPYSRFSSDAVQLVGKLIEVARKERGITATELAERAGISRGLLQRIEKGDPNCRIGSVFEVAAIVGIRLFDADKKDVTNYLREFENKLTLLPKTVRHKTTKLYDDF